MHSWDRSVTRSIGNRLGWIQGPAEASSAQFTVIQDGPISVSPGGSVRLTCSLSTSNVNGENRPTWIYQILGSVPKLVIGSSGTSNQNYRPSWTSDRFTGSITGGSAVLSISKLEIGDTGDYYCIVWSGTQCTVVQKIQNTDTYTSSLLYILKTYCNCLHSVLYFHTQSSLRHLLTQYIYE
ncbi:unnamed protein product [Ranitomeya imitator]|uniref:Ig-like domain-containing protein n=1 Tax=Ranitomeya imitator TaxID=111125 RepID=A0ABN9MC77_9NEOB|nr:unnamed protein product [Ranitomeya imitator]